MKYYYLKADEIIQEGDEFRSDVECLDPAKWTKVAKDEVGTPVQHETVWSPKTYRRLHNMVKVKDLTIYVEYKVGLGDLEMPEIVKSQLEAIEDGYFGIDGLASHKYPEADQWLKENIKERDCFHLEYTVEEIS